ncbi:MAG: aminopeptidase [Clostridia bacterium]|nr:aminopeptidase [Clostridia bacterium]
MKNEELKEKLCYKRESGYKKQVDLKEINDFCESYKKFLNIAKTERDAVEFAIAYAEGRGFKEFKRGMTLKTGDKVYANNRNKAVIFAVIGNKGMEDGARIAAAHIDAPCIHLKQNPVYEDSGLCLFKTHYYGGIKKYQWPTIPLELRGVVALKNGKTVKISVGSNPDDPIFTITDLLPHLGKDQMQKSLSEGVPGESLNVLIGSRPLEGEGDELVKLNILNILNEQYGIVEEDFLSAELMVVPAFDARDVGFDRSLIGAYGHDDRVCAYPALRAIAEGDTPEYTSICILADKEEIGSEGVSGMKSAHFDTFMEDLCEMQNARVRVCYENSTCMSADVAVGFDPNFPEVLDKRNGALINSGITLCKYTGSRGKSGASDAAAELVAHMRNVFDADGVIWQMGALGKVDQGGGGTVAMYMAERNISTIDAGVPVLSMHAPFEVVSKLDVYMAYKATKAFFKN